jgi:hypothetical protein
MNLFNEIAIVAYELYEKNGYTQNRDLDHWLEAEKIVMARLAEQKKIRPEKKSANKPEKKTEAKVEPKTKRPLRKKTK